jgi:ubiquitin-protein ligase E3 C
MRARPQLTGTDSFTQRAYYEFAVSFLTQPELLLFESNIASFAEVVDVDRLSDSLSTGIIPDPTASESQVGLMWLLSHFIILQKTRKQLVLHSRSLRVLYSLLAALSTQIRAGFAASALKTSGEARDLDDVPSDIEDVPQPALAPYVSDQLASLTDRDEISGLLEKFTS